MADKQISALPEATTVQSADLFVLEQTSTAKKLQGSTLITYLGNIWNAYGGVTDITQYWAVSSSNSTAPSTWYTTLQTMTSTNRYLWSYMTITYSTGASQNTTKQVVGVYGDTGDDWYVHFKYSSVSHPVDSDLTDTPSEYVGVYSGTSSTAPTTATSYTWYEWKGLKGDTGTSITSVAKTGTSGVVDTYTITFSNGNTSTFTLTNGSSIASIAKTATNGLVDTYTVTLTDGTSSTFTVTNGKGIASITLVGDHSAGSTDTYTITYNDGDTYSFQVYNGANGAGAVSTVDGIQAVGQDVPLLTIGQGAPTTATVGSAKSRYFDSQNSILYICLGYDSGTQTYDWRGSGVTVDSAMSTSSTNPVQNAVISSKVGTVALTTTAQNCSSAINEHETDIGDMQLDTTATNLTGAINEHETDITALNNTLGSTALPTTAQTVTGAIDEIHTEVEDKIQYYYQQTVSVASNAQIMRIPSSGTSSSISTDTVVLECTFAAPSYITSDVTWTSYAGYIAFTGTCTTATTANVTLGNKGN